MDINELASNAISNLDYRFPDVLDSVIRALNTDTLVDITLFLMRTYDDNAELTETELNELREYANKHGING